jgi:hypothetical protein
MRNVEDRRGHVRLEVVGLLWGTLQVLRPARIVNMNNSGVLIASPVPLPIDTIHAFQVTLEGHALAVEGLVRHVRATTSPSGSMEYQIGVEFLSTPGALTES